MSDTTSPLEKMSDSSSEEQPSITPDSSSSEEQPSVTPDSSSSEEQPSVTPDDDDDDEEQPSVTPDDEKVEEAVMKTLEEVLQTGEEEVDDETDDETDDEVDEYKKFDESVRENYILKHHPELNHSNYSEISALTKIVKNSSGNVIDPLHTTVPFLTKFEKARVLGLRTKQINSGSDIYIDDIPESIIDGRIIAEMELEAKKIPFIISRPLPNGKKEYWKLEDLELIDY